MESYVIDCHAEHRCIRQLGLSSNVTKRDDSELKILKKGRELLIVFESDISSNSTRSPCSGRSTKLCIQAFVKSSDNVLLRLQYMSHCIRRHAKLLSETCLYYKTCHTILSKTRLEYRTHQLSIDVTMTSFLL